MESMYLHGAETVERAASSMRSAAEQFSQAVSNLEAMMENQRRYMDEWIGRLEAAMEKGQAKD